MFFPCWSSEGSLRLRTTSETDNQILLFNVVPCASLPWRWAPPCDVATQNGRVGKQSLTQLAFKSWITSLANWVKSFGLQRNWEICCGPGAFGEFAKIMHWYWSSLEYFVSEITELMKKKGKHWVKIFLSVIWSVERMLFDSFEF